MTDVLDRVLRLTGFTTTSGDVEGLRRSYDADSVHLEAAFSPRAGLRADAVYEASEGPKLVVKELRPEAPPEEREDALHERAWNLGLAPLLWVVTPIDVRVYDAYRGVGRADQRSPVGTFRVDVKAEMEALNEACGRFALDTGAFWSSPLAKNIDRNGKVDRVLLEEIRALEDRLVKATSTVGDRQSQANARKVSQEIVTCTLFASYLLHRGIAQPLLSPTLQPDLEKIFSSRAMAAEFFDWLHVTFNGDVFPADVGSGLQEEHLALLRDFVAGTSLTRKQEGQMRLFRFHYDTVPIELISSIYESFARRAAGDMAKRLGLHYTPVTLVHMALDPVCDGLSPDARILDMTCGSGLFLVLALRRLVWKRCRDLPRSRTIVRKVLYEQVHGIDIEPAALRIACFSLYLAALELEETAAPEEPIKFEHLIGKTLHQADSRSANTVGLIQRIAPDAIVGNPPWTHVPKGTEEREEAKKKEGGRRSPDQEFLSTAINAVGSDGRLALYLKASSFLSLEAKATSFRHRVIRGLNRLAILNLSPLRHEGLFADAQSPGLLLCANCGELPPEGDILVGTFPWTPDFVRSGALALSSADVAVIDKERALAAPATLKASLLGTPRDVRLMERIEGRFGTFAALLDDAGVHSGQGFQIKGLKQKPIEEEIRDLPAIFPKDYKPLSLDDLRLPSLRELNHASLLRPRDMIIYRGPLLVFPKSAHRMALQHGRTSAALSSRNLAYSHGFYGFSFSEADPRLSTILCAILNSCVPGYQFLFGPGAMGMERPSIQLQDLRAMRVPKIAPDDKLAAAASAALASARTDGCRALDHFATRLYGLDPDERDLVIDGVNRAKSTFLDSPKSRAQDVASPSERELGAYAEAACGTVNAALRFSSKRKRLVAAIARSRPAGGDPLDRFVAVRFAMDGARETPGSTATPEDVMEEVRDHLVRAPTPYLRERRSLRIYGSASVTILKPAQRRYWTVAAAMQDGDAILADHWNAPT